jgi:hypothetical protein
MPDLLVCVEGDASDDDAVALREALTDLTLDGWTYRPEFVDQVDAMPAGRPDELPALRTVGVLVELPEPGETVDEHAIRKSGSGDGCSSFRQVLVRQSLAEAIVSASPRDFASSNRAGLDPEDRIRRPPCCSDVQSRSGRAAAKLVSGTRAAADTGATPLTPTPRVSGAVGAVGYGAVTAIVGG